MEQKPEFTRRDDLCRVIAMQRGWVGSRAECAALADRIIAEFIDADDEEEDWRSEAIHFGI